MFLSGTQHLNPVFTVGGRRVVCGPDLWLYWHGVDTEERKREISSFMSDPAEHLDVLERYQVDYIYVSSYERSDYRVDMEAMDRLWPIVFQNWEATVYRVREE